MLLLDSNVCIDVLRGRSDVVARFKPIETLGAAPGAALNWAVVPMLAAMLWWSLCCERAPEPDG